MRRAVRIGAGFVLALGIVTCTDQSVTGPKHPASAALDFRALAAAKTPGAPHIPVDSLEITFRRADGSVALDQVLGFRADTLVGDSAVIRINLELSQSSETFTVAVRAFGGGLDWYSFSGTVQVTAGATAQPALTGQYVGPGASAARVLMRPVDTTAVGGTLFPLRAIAYGSAGDSITGVPIGYRTSDSTRASITYVTPFAAQLTAALSLRDSVWVVAETPTHLKDSTRVHLVPQPAKLVVISGNNQTGVIGAALKAPLVVRVLDALGAGFKGDSVSWLVTPGTATLSAARGVTDDTGYAQVTVTPLQLGSFTVQATAKAIAGPIAQSPASFTAIAGAGNVKKVVISPKLDTIAYGAPPVQYSATLYDSLNNVVSAIVLWSSTVTSVATVDGTGLATAVTGDSTRIIAASGGYADTARLYVRALRTITVGPGDTVITAVGDSLRLRTQAFDNFGAPVTTGLKIKFLSASPGVVSVDTTGRARILGPGNGVVLARDSVAPTIVAQGSATLHVNQVTRSILNNPPDSVVVGVSGQTQVVATALDSNGYAIPGKTFGWGTRNSALATVSSSGLVTGVALGSTYAVDSVDGYRDSTRVVVSGSPPKLLQWAFDSTAVGNGGSVSIGLSVTSPAANGLTVNITSTDTTIAKASPNSVTIGVGASATSVGIVGVRAGSAVLTATDPSGQYQPKQMKVGVVSTITFREIASPGSQQLYFYLNQNETHKAQVWLSDPAPPGGLGITFVYRNGYAAVTPSPALIPAGQLSADITLQGVRPGAGGQPDSVVPSLGGYIGKFSYVYVAPDSLRLNLPYPGYNGVLGVGQFFQPAVAFTYVMDHPLQVSAALSSPRGMTQSLDTIRTGSTSQLVTVSATAPGPDTLTFSAPGWVSTSAALTFTTPHIGVSGTTSMVAGDPNHGYWSVTSEDSLHYGHQVVDTLRVTLASPDTTIVAVDSPRVKILPSNSSATIYSALRAQPAAGGRSVKLVASAPGYTSDSFQVIVQAPTLTLAYGYPYDGKLAVGTSFVSAGSVAIPYARSDTFKVALVHSKKSVVAGPDTVVIPKGQTTGYFNIRGDTLNGTDTISVPTAAGYAVAGSPLIYHVDSIHVRPTGYPSPLYTISVPQAVTAYAYDAASANQVARPLTAPLRVGLSLSDTLLRLDSAAVTIPAGSYTSNADTLRVVGQDTTGAYLRTSAPGSRPDSAGPIKVLPTPLTINFGYPYSGAVGRGLVLQSNSVAIPAAAPNTLSVAIQRYNPAKDSLSSATVLIAKGASGSQPFTIIGLDSTGTDSMTAMAPGFVTARATITPSLVHVALQGGLGGSHLTTEPPQTIAVYPVLRTSGYGQYAAAPVTLTITSSDSTVIRMDSAFSLIRGDFATSVVATGASVGYFRVRYVGSGTARIRVAATGFSPDSSALVTVTGPSLYFYTAPVTAGIGQVFLSEQVYVNNAVAAPLVVHLQRSDSMSLPGAQTFALSVDSVTIPANMTVSTPFDIIGQNQAAAQLTARAPGYSQAAASVAIGQPRLGANLTTLSLYVGAPPTAAILYTEDQTNTSRVVASTLTVSAASSAPTIAVPDSASVPIATRTNSALLGITGLAKGSTAIVFSAPNYKADTMQVSVDTAQITINSAPNGLGVNQTAQMFVSIPFSTPSAVTVSLSASPAGVLAIPASVTIPAGSNVGYFNVTGAGQGVTTLTATAMGFYAAAPVNVSVGQAQLSVSVNATVTVGTKTTLTVYAQDANGVGRNVTQPLTVTLVSSSPAQTTFDATTITIPVGSNFAQTGVTFNAAGPYTITASASGYTSASGSVTAQ